MTLGMMTSHLAQRDQVTPHVTILLDRCAGCEECVVRCPTGALSMDSATWTAVADDAACVGCRQCQRTCPFSAIFVDGPVLIAPRMETKVHHPVVLEGSLEETRAGIGGWAGAIAEADRCLLCPDPTCVRGCPVHNDIPGFIGALREGDLDRAHLILRRTTVLPDICSRVCDQSIQCEGACTWSLAGEKPVAIGALERFIADNSPVPPLQRTTDHGAGLKVAVVGSGPGSIAATWELAQAGAEVTVFEKDEEPGGLLRWGIPDFTLPDNISSRPWEALVEGGVVLKTNHAVDPAEVESLLSSHDAVILAYGAQVPIRPPIEGSELEGVWDSTKFLSLARKALRDGTPLLQKESRLAKIAGHEPTVLVVGAGNTAMDVARLARRLGVRAICVDWMDRRFAPVRPDELEEASTEGVEVLFSTTIGRIIGLAGHVSQAKLSSTKQRKSSKSPHIVNEEARTENVDLVVFAMGYRRDGAFAQWLSGPSAQSPIQDTPDRRWQASGVLSAGKPAFARHQAIGSVSMRREERRILASRGASKRVWVVGDALVGPCTVVEAMAQGKSAAQAVLEVAAMEGKS